ncbi:LCP family protein [Paenibacillus aquistagni]|uniref:Transcriptional attenuator, LytR family n=1 Tax=Paenibacillus aquistagni TaxID=1852522 RepID=A0A1X7IFR2_9BACL|nr:LCP family protein [Paenibacillus aquistagni]SMG13087.1 transcriptional attenuator, LytR family [Paenibacillus aquistagni]
MNHQANYPPRHARHTQSKRKKKKKKGMATWLKVLFTVLILMLLAILVYAGYLIKYGNDSLGRISTVPNTAGGSSSNSSKEPVVVKEEPFSFILMGIDYRKELPGLRTDVVMVGAIHPDTQEAVLVSLPRDTYFQIPGYGPDKLNHFYPNFHSLQKKGVLDSATPEDEMKIMLGQYMGMDLDHAAVINFQGFVDAVDALGGVNVNVDQNMCYRDRADGTNINLKAGQQTLNGQETLDFVRYRKSNCSPMTKGTTDFDRNVRQNAVLQELIGKMQSFGGIAKVTDLIDAIADNFKVDMTPEQMRSVLTTYLMIDRSNIHYISVDGNWVSPYIYVDENKLAEAKQMIHDVLEGKSINPPAESTEGTADSSVGEGE